MRITPLIVGATIFLSASTGAQSQPASPAEPQPPAPTGPTSAAANSNHAVRENAASRPTEYVRPEDQAAYDADLAAYRAELRANRRQVRVDDAITARQERAYADAMHAWRIQVADCRRGLNAACRAPSPRPGDFMQ